MSTSKFNELVEILTKDYEETNEYLERNCTFINQLTQELRGYLGCDLENLFCYNLTEDKKKPLVHYKIQDLIFDDSIKVMNDCYFLFPLLIQIKPELFNSYYCSPSFKKNKFTPMSQVVLAMSIKQEQKDLFAVIAPAINPVGKLIEERFVINLTIDNPWIEFLESCFKVIKKFVEGGLEKRILESVSETDNTPKRAFGVYID
jgi:hypothetical protein